MADLPDWLEDAENDPSQISLFDAPAPPTGPTVDDYKRKDGKLERFIDFLSTEEGRRYWSILESSALRALNIGQKRFSTRTFVERYRAQTKTRLNNDFSVWSADLLVDRHPDLLDIIERRKRKR
jgi:hypothetical protein|tara:strand:+ start:178 stop:549 length:372 start_codon:yes stop_codon:yes gene_type:complete